MAIPHEQYGQIIRFLTGDLDESEQKSLQLWRDADPANETAFREVEQIWLNSNIRFEDNIDDTTRQWASLNKLLETPGEQGRQIQFPLSLVLKVAAAILVVVLTIIYLIPRAASIETFTIASQGEVQMVMLPDSSTVWLNSNSSLSYTEDFGTNERHVVLEGEAFFDVTRNENVPFIVTAQGAVVRVLGTSFNLKNENGTVALVVEEGRVRFTHADSVQHAGVTVVANEQAVIKADGVVLKEKVSSNAYRAWRTSDVSTNENNPFETEANDPASFIHTDFSWKKNTINQSVIEGSIASDADHAVYKNIVLLVRQTTAKSKVVETRITLQGPLKPGKKIKFEKRLGDILRGTRKMEIIVESAEAQHSDQ